jgi:hypothetical protein
MRRFGLLLTGMFVLLAGCAQGTVPTMATSPEAFKTIQTARYRPADQLRFMDCVYDGFLRAAGNSFPTFARQVKRADGYRLDVIWVRNQYVVADFKDDGTYLLSVWTNSSQIPVGREVEAAEACVKTFGQPI